MLDDPANQGNTARFTFLNPASRVFFPDWEENADDMVATLRTYAGQNPLDKKLTDLIGELVTRSDTFRHRWSKHNVRHHWAGIKRIHHPEVGDLELSYDAMEFPANPDWFMFAFTAEPGSPTEERLKLLGTLSVTAQSRGNGTSQPPLTRGGLLRWLRDVPSRSTRALRPPRPHLRVPRMRVRSRPRRCSRRSRPHRGA